MPTSGTHITVVQRLALNPQLQQLLGNPNTDPAVEDPTSAKFDPQGVIRMKFASLGAVGPDILYAMLDFGADSQDYENFLIKVGGSFACLAELKEQLGTYIDGVQSVITLGITDSLLQQSELVTGVFKELILGSLVAAGLNLWPFPEPKRQQDRPREEWFWADYLHYIRSGRFAGELLRETKRRLDSDPGNTQHQNLYAYALGYLTHYVVDVVGHPYVNQVVQAPFRLHWQRHHLVENFIDAYVWDRWHRPRPPFPPPTLKEQPLDEVLAAPNAMGAGASCTYARLHDYISIGASSLGDPVDALVEQVCDKIKAGLFDAGIAEGTEPPEPTDADFVAWTELMASTIRVVYDAQERHPLKLANPAWNLPGGPREGGYPKPEDIGAAYGAMRLLLKLGSEEKITEPEAPDIVTDISQDVQRLLDNLQNNLSTIPSPPPLGSPGNLNLDDLWKAIKNSAVQLADVAEKVAETVIDFVKDAIRTAGDIVSDSIKFALYLLNKALYALYRSARIILMLNAYVLPFTDELAENFLGLFNTNSLWGSAGDLGANMYPAEELALAILGQIVVPQRDYIHPPLAPYPPYAPFIPPATLSSAVEQPPVGLAAPYVPAAGAALTTPDDFIDAPRGPDDMFAPGGPQPMAPPNPDPRARSTFASEPRNFGGAMANCEWAILHWQDPGFVLPDYNLDGDRGYAWPCWDVEGMVQQQDPPVPPTDPNYVNVVPVPLDPADARNGGVAHVNVGPAN